MSENRERGLELGDSCEPDPKIRCQYQPANFPKSVKEQDPKGSRDLYTPFPGQGTPFLSHKVL